MKFIFPQNYNFKSKLFGFIDYPVAILNIFLFAITYLISNIFINSISIKIIITICLCFPIFLISLVGFNHENIIYVFIYILKFYKNRRVYLYHP